MPSFIKFSSLRGIDRDGNPFVTTEVTKETLVNHFNSIINLYIKDLTDLIKVLTISSNEIKISDELLGSLEKDKVLIETFTDLETRNKYGPYRIKLALIKEKLKRSLDFDKETIYKGPKDLLEDLRIIRESLESHACNSSVETLIKPLEFKIKTFGFHFAKLDIRQNSEVLENSVEEIVQRKLNKSFLAMSEEER